MTWLTWRQSRTQTLVALAALAAIAVTLGSTGPHLAHLFHIDIAGCLGQSGSDACSNDTLHAFTDNYGFLQHLFGYALIAIPGLIGAFWGAPLVSSELEAGTHRLIWNQTVTRTRWLAVKVGLIGLTSAVSAGLFSLMLTWWSNPLDRVNANRITPTVFDQRGIDPIGWAIFAFALGVTAGVVIRRTLPAMGTTMAIFTTVRIVWPIYIRQHLIPGVNNTVGVGTVPYDWVGVNAGPNSAMVVHVSMPGAWILSEHTVNAAGHQVPGSTLFPLCPPTADGSGLKHAPDSCFIQHLIQLGYNKTVLTYQPASRFWPLQFAETGILATIAVLLAAFCYWRIRHGKLS
jgi:hypothetical protein